ncbi:MAG: glycoside hydrolase family 30 protein [Chitinophagaceae bacterium]
MFHKKQSVIFTFLATFFIVGLSCSKKSSSVVAQPSHPITKNDVSVWITKPDQSIKLLKQYYSSNEGKINNTFPVLSIDPATTLQTVDGFGFTLTGGSAYLINKLPTGTRISLLNELFGKDENSIGISYLRISLGASDLSKEVFSYNDLSIGQTDSNLSAFTLAQDTVDLIPILREILDVNPSIKLMASPWSPPVWMKDNKSSKGGKLLKEFYATYASYFVKYIQQMKLKGINIDAVTIQNEPMNPDNNPSLKMEALEQADFIKNHLGPAFQANNINTKIIIWDHNCDLPEYPLQILADADASQYIDGSAFHLYAGNISALSTVKSAYPNKNIYFTEQWTSKDGDFGGDLKWHIKNVIIGSLQNWSRVALEWNLANDAAYGPHTPGGCTACKGALTIDGAIITRNVPYYIIAHVSKFIPPGSVRIAHTAVANLPAVAFKTPESKIVMLVINDAESAQSVNIKLGDKWVKVDMSAGTVATIIM